MNRIKFSGKKLVSLVATSSCAILLMMSLLFYQGYRLIIEHTPLVDAINSIKLETTTAHLWFEEIAGGDQGESIQVVWKQLAQADSYAAAILSGDEINGAELAPLTNATERKLIEKVRLSLPEFKRVAEERYQNIGSSNEGPGSELDKKFDAIFEQFIYDVNLVETKLKLRISTEVNHYIVWFFCLFFASLSLFIFVTRVLQISFKKNISLLTSLKKTNLEIANKNLELDYKAHFDSLTGLPNRVLFIDRLQEQINASRRENSEFALLFIDLDHFKAVNDQYGHQAGDFVLEETAQRLESSLQNNDSATRISGDEFAVIINSFQDLNAVSHVAQKILNAVADPIVMPNSQNRIQISASMGISVYPRDSEIGEELINSADTAMYHAKQSGKNRFSFHSKALSEEVRLIRETEYGLARAIEENEFVIHYQPQMSIETGELYGFEALVRWNEPEKGLLYPDKFIGIAEQIGLIAEIDHYVFREVIWQIKEWNASGLEFHRVSVNFSPISFEKPDFISRIVRQLTEENIDGNKIQLEFVESALLKDIKHTQSVLQTLRNLNIKIAIDDFGTGYSSISYLKDLPADTLKIDKSFISDFEENTASAIVLRHIVMLAKALGLDVVAEGIETEWQEKIISEMGVEKGQGYYYSRPKPIEGLKSFLNKYIKSSNVVPMKNVNKKMNNS